MDFQRFFLMVVFFLSSLMLWENWQSFQHPYVEKSINRQLQPQLIPPEKKGSAASGQPVFEKTGVEHGVITVKTDTFLLEIDKEGGDIKRIVLLKHKDRDDINKSIVLFDNKENYRYFAQSGLMGGTLPTHRAIYTSMQNSYELSADEQSLNVLLEADSGDWHIAKTLTFARDSNLVKVSYEIENKSGNAIENVSAYFQLIRDANLPEGDSKLVPTYTGPAIYTDLDKFKKIDFSELSKNDHDISVVANNGWAAMLQHYFVSAWLVNDSIDRELFAKKLGENLYATGMIVPVGSILPHEKKSVSSSLYAGPAHAGLDKIVQGLGLTVDYGWLTILASPLFVVLTYLQNWVHNWGMAIILLTILIKLAFFPLSAASYRSMAKMRLVAPKLEKIKQQFSDDRDGLNRAMMDLYKTEKINPLGGCLPVLVQIPVFIALYWAILSSVELRHAPFFGWITDLSATDPYYVLPLIMGISMFVQSKLNPTPPDPIQAKIMQIMPLIFSVVFFFFPAGLVLYSIVNNLLSIGQQWYITRNQEIELGNIKKL